MRIAFFTPVSGSSAIGRVSLLLCRALRELGHEVVVVATDEIEHAPAERVPELGYVVHWSAEAEVLLALGTTDAVVHQIGDNYRFHAGSLAWLDRVGGIVCLHDFFLGGLFVNWATRGNDAEAQRILSTWYGRDLDWFYSMAQTGDIISGCWPEVSFVEWVTSKASGVITHSDFGIESVLRGTGTPVAIAALPYDLRYRVTSVGRTPNCRVLTFGAINPNKSAAVIVRAIGSDPELRTRVQYRLAGHIDEAVRAELTELASSLVVDLVILGPVSDEELTAEITAAAAIACIRLPALESASASAIESMLAARPILVAATGFYASLPDDTVLRVDPADPIPDVQRHLHGLIDHPADAQERGRRARDYARATFRADSYARDILGMAARVARDTPRTEVLRSIAETASAWGVPPGSPLLAGSLSVSDFFTVSHDDIDD